MVPHGCKGAGLGHFRIMLPSFAAVEEARGGCPSSGGNFPEAESPLLTPSHYFKGSFHCQGTVNDQVLASAMTNQHLMSTSASLMTPLPA